MSPSGPLPDFSVFVYGSRPEAEAVAAAIATSARQAPVPPEQPVLVILSPRQVTIGTLYLSPEALAIGQRIGFELSTPVRLRADQLPSGVSLYYGQMGKTDQA